MNMQNLFLICPECNLERKITRRYESNNFFLTALGAIFEFENNNILNQICFLINNEKITHLYIVNDFHCVFITQTILNNSALQLDPQIQSTFKVLMADNIKSFDKLNLEDKLKNLAKLNIAKQASIILENDALRSKIESGELVFNGLLYDRYTNKFNEIKLGVNQAFNH